MKPTYENNPNCSSVLVAKGKTTFVYFYYRLSDGKRKQVKFSKGLNSSEHTPRNQKKALNEMLVYVNELLKSKFYNGRTFVDIPRKVERAVPLANIDYTSERAINRTMQETIYKLIDEYLENKGGQMSKNRLVAHKSALHYFKKYVTETFNQEKRVRAS